MEMSVLCEDTATDTWNTFLVFLLTIIRVMYVSSYNKQASKYVQTNQYKLTTDWDTSTTTY